MTSGPRGFPEAHSLHHTQEEGLHSLEAPTAVSSLESDRPRFASRLFGNKNIT